MLYYDGLVGIKHPALAFFGDEQYRMEFSGSHNTHTMKIHAIAHRGLVNSSSNPNYKLVSASLNANDTDSNFVYITTVNLHDENLNVVMRSNVAQPVLKRHGSKIKFLIRQDF